MAHFLFPSIEPFQQGTLAVSELHTIHYEQVGNPQGHAALFLHGGPGLGILPVYRRFFDPEHYRVVLPDQRGAGRSTPYAELRENNTWEIVADLEKLRKHLGIEKWLVMGGSWGSLLALCYAIKHPESVSGLILRGVFLGSQKELDWVYGGTGTAQIFPDQWAAFKTPIPDTEDCNAVSAYYSLLTSDDKDVAQNAAACWANFGAQTMTLLPDSPSSRDISNSDKMVSLARTECHFSHHKFFLESDNFVLDNVHKIQQIPTRIVHGRYDAICAVSSAWNLQQAMQASEASNCALHIVADGAHIPTEAGMVHKLIEATEQFKNIS